MTTMTDERRAALHADIKDARADLAKFKRAYFEAQTQWLLQLAHLVEASSKANGREILEMTSELHVLAQRASHRFDEVKQTEHMIEMLERMAARS